MASYLYAVVTADSTLPQGLTGLGSAPLGIVRHHDLAAVVSQVDADEPLGGRAHVLAHGEVLRALVEHGATVLPVRFGAVFDDDTQVADIALAEREQDLTEVLDGLDGRCQLTLRARYDESAVLAEVVEENRAIAELRDLTRGRPEETTYHHRVRLGELVAQALEDKRQADGQTLIDALAPHSVACSVLAGAGVDHLAELAFLVDRDLVGEFEESAEALAASMAPRASLALVGPVAPYDFVGGE